MPVELFKNLEPDKKIAVFTHPEPDPDALGSCLGMKWIVERFCSAEADIFMDGDYSSRRQNMALINVLGIQLKPIEEYLSAREDYCSAVVVDAGPKRLPEGIVPNVVIDHHSITLDEDAHDFCRVERIGSCCTLVFELMEQCGCQLSASSEREKVIATAMLEGIRSDTDMYRREETTARDYAASISLFQYADGEMLNQIERCKLPRYHFELRAEIIRPENFEIVNGATFIACAGCLSAAKTASLPILADEIINDMEGIATSIIFAIVGERAEVRMRSNDVSVDVNRFLQKHFGDYAGAKRGSGGASLPLGIFGIQDLPEDVRASVYETAKAVIMTVLSREVKSE